MDSPILIIFAGSPRYIRRTDRFGCGMNAVKHDSAAVQSAVEEHWDDDDNACCSDKHTSVSVALAPAWWKHCNGSETSPRGNSVFTDSQHFPPSCASTIVFETQYPDAVELAWWNAFWRAFSQAAIAPPPLKGRIEYLSTLMLNRRGIPVLYANE
jgi:hypothetical protein